MCFFHIFFSILFVAWSFFIFFCYIFLCFCLLFAAASDCFLRFSFLLETWCRLPIFLCLLRTYSTRFMIVCCHSSHYPGILYYFCILTAKQFLAARSRHAYLSIFILLTVCCQKWWAANENKNNYTHNT